MTLTAVGRALIRAGLLCGTSTPIQAGVVAAGISGCGI